MTPAVSRGDGPLLLGQPHGGLEIPDGILARLNAAGRARADTDWHIGELYADLAPRATVVSTPIHRYVIDANRDPADTSLYPGQNTTALCPTTTFDGEPIYRAGEAPSSDEIAERQQRYHQPYHDALRTELDRIHQRHGYVILYDCHSIRSHIPFLFEGRLPDFNIGTNDTTTCDPAIENGVAASCAAADDYTAVVNGRFRGGWTTRHYGQPESGYHAIQMELAQRNYMLEESPWDYLGDRAARLRAILRAILERLESVFD